MIGVELTEEQADAEIAEIFGQTRHCSVPEELDCPECDNRKVLVPDVMSPDPNKAHCHLCGTLSKVEPCHRCGEPIVKGTLCLRHG